MKSKSFCFCFSGHKDTEDDEHKSHEKPRPNRKSKGHISTTDGDHQVEGGHQGATNTASSDAGAAAAMLSTATIVAVVDGGSSHGGGGDGGSAHGGGGGDGG